MIKKRRAITGFISLVLGLALTFTPYARAVELVITENGAGSSSEINTTVETATTVEQNNEANVSNDVETDANTGDNSASGNTGGDVAIETGDITQEVGLETSVNSSVVDAGCCPQDIAAVISGNGSDSQNTIDIAQKNETNITVSQQAKVTNNVEGNANTGENNANNNTGGNITIDTGNIYVAGGIKNGPINSASVKGSAGGGSVSAKISGNGADSTNAIVAYLTNDADVFLNFNAHLDNFVNWDLNTGRNNANRNTGGDVSIETGDIFFDFFIKNGPINFGEVELICCDIFDPGEPPGDGPPGDGPHDPGGDGDDGDDGGGGDGGGGGGGGSIASGAAVEAGGPGIAGLSDTSSDGARALFFMAGLAMMAVGAQLVGREAFDKFRARKNG